MNRSIKLGIVIVTVSILLVMLPTVQKPAQSQAGATEAPAGFDNQTNGHISQADFDAFRASFEETETIQQGLGPTFNDTSCANCHKVPVTGGSGKKIPETRAGHLDAGGNFVEHPGGSLVQDQALNQRIIEHVLPGEDTTSRSSTNVLGNGFVEAISDTTLTGIRDAQPPNIRGLAISVPILEAANGSTRVGRFGWKNQHASLESFSADAYLNEMGITSPLQPVENTSDGNDVSAFDAVPDPEDVGGVDVKQFAQFMRATKVPPRDPLLVGKPDTIAGAQLFGSIGCAGCHTPTITTAPSGTVFNGGFTVSAALGNKIVHPYSDFLLHDIGTHDPIVQNGGPATYNKVRTAPLWGVRTRSFFLHDLSAPSLTQAIQSHRGQAQAASDAFQALSTVQQKQLLTFLDSL
jgi:CxxC motif-containing protein (DUF1111 family)